MFSNFSRIGNVLGVMLFCIFVMGKITLINGQSDNSFEESYYQWFDNAVGEENSGLYNGMVYREKHRMTSNRQKFFQSTDYLRGSIDYDGQQYFDVIMKYDVYDDQVIIRLNNVLLLNNEKIKNFSIDGHKFEKVDYSEKSNSSISGFVEVLFENEFFDFIKKHKKELREKFGNKLIFHEFKDKNEYFLFYQSKYQRISSRGDIAKVFPDLANKIKKQFPKSRRKLSEQDYLHTILAGVNLMLSEEKPKVIE